VISHLYRFRPISAVLDNYEELAKQEIYFSTPEELNDPMEGYKDVFWSGDRIVWRNLLRHYVLCAARSRSSRGATGATVACFAPAKRRRSSLAASRLRTARNTSHGTSPLPG
jgi:hypothetical protein